MNKPQAKERFLRWVAIPAMAAVLVGLAVLQYRWSGQVSDATRAQMLSNLQVSLMSFRQDLARELGAAAVEIRAVADSPNAVKPEELKEQFHHLEQNAAHPNLISHIYLWQDPTHQKPLRFDPASDQFERTSWPAEFDPMQQRLLEITMAHHPPDRGPEASRPRRDGERRYEFGSSRTFGSNRQNRTNGGANTRRRMPEMMMPWAIDQSIPAIAFPLRRRMSSSGPPSTADVTWLIIQMDPNVLSNDGERVVYSSGPGSGEEKNLPVDATLNLFGPPFGHGGPTDRGVEFFSSPTR